MEKLMEQGKRAHGYVPKLKTYIKNYYVPYFLDQNVREIFSCSDLSEKLPDMKVRKKDEPMSFKYQSLILEALSVFFKWLQKERIIEQLPMIPTVDVPEHDPQTITSEIQDKLLDFIPVEHKPIFTYLFRQGARPGEVPALLGDVIEDDVVTYKRTFSGRRLNNKRTKTGKIRKNLIFPEVLALLPTTFPGQFVFTHGKIKKRPYSYDFLNRIFKKALTKFNEKYGASLSVELYEATKHSFGTQLINMGVPEELLQKWFGHTKREMTAKYTKMKVVDAFRNLTNIIDIHKKVSDGTVSKPSVNTQQT
jgi:integrase